MKIDKLPVDIWHNIIKIGVRDLQILTLTDILSLSEVNRLLHNALHDNIIWYDIFRWYYFDLITQYNVNEVQSSEIYQRTIVYSSDIRYFEKTMMFYHKDIKFRFYMEKYRPREQVYNISFFLDNFSDMDYIPIIKNYENDRRKCDYDDLAFDITRRSLACNLLNTYNFKLGIRYFNKLIKEDIRKSPSAPGAFEWFWYKMNSFDKAFSDMIFSRQSKLTEVYALLYKEVYLEILQHRSWGDKVKFFQNDESSKGTIIFQDNKTFGKLMWHILRLILSKFGRKCKFYSSQEYYEYMDTYCLEDFSILRIYNEDFKGHHILLYSILMKILDEFLLSKYNFKIGTQNSSENISINFSNTFLMIKNHYFLIPRDANNSYVVDHYTSKQVIQYLRAEFNLSTLAQISNYLKPLSLKDMLVYFMNLDTKCGVKPSYSVSQPELNSILDKPEKNEVGMRSCVGYKYKEYQFAKFVCDFLRMEYKEGGFSKFMYCSEFEKHFNQENNFIYFNSVIEVIESDSLKKKMLVEYFKLNLDDKSRIFRNNFNLMDPANSRIAFQRMNPRLDVENNANVINGETYKRGMLVGHNKFHSLGIVLDIINSTSSPATYCKVYTSQGYIETYSTSSLRNISRNIVHKTDSVAKIFIDVCGIDVLGLLLFSSFKNDPHAPGFIQID
ncbi:DEHA2G16632p [Debaryomyces hansenii CBS767]|uniref:DEHA2G16632p n=1 Tax=Debaryomyces hansenii (strain ATCC 36239 / CBS 767 / BCRC 21394 / JCM 1990 / NBRC 0083 / IGC 2968) TaxID=284592 RepID=B5RUU1_DEBHA|nr:DEHA2G16632p [Debaryomyces hansenii CBS767]CAR65985.1 DEHA2G16632p [Debaryomyces hansenii CBS767]|eukprot:XP_002770652.1 DEHA2G16632p [Debaryomyces hansenii CBS767]